MRHRERALLFCVTVTFEKKCCQRRSKTPVFGGGGISFSGRSFERRGEIMARGGGGRGQLLLLSSASTVRPPYVLYVCTIVHTYSCALLSYCKPLRIFFQISAQGRGWLLAAFSMQMTPVCFLIMSLHTPESTITYGMYGSWAKTNVGVLISLAVLKGRIRLPHRLLHLLVTPEQACLLLKYHTGCMNITRSCKALRDPSTMDSTIILPASYQTTITINMAVAVGRAG